MSDAIDKTMNVTRYRLELKVLSQAMIDELEHTKDRLPGLLPERAKIPAIPADTPVMDMAGEFDQRNTHFTFKGVAALRFLADPTQGLELIAHDDKVYYHGMGSLIGLDPNSWYLTNDRSLPPYLPDAFQFFSTFSAGTPNLATFPQGSQMTIDNQTCRAYHGDQPAALRALMAVLHDMNPSNFDAIQTGDLTLWACDDGYVHEILLSLMSANKQQPGQTIDCTMRFHLFDFERQDIAITAPANAQPLPAPNMIMATAQSLQGPPQP